MCNMDGQRLASNKDFNCLHEQWASAGGCKQYMYVLLSATKLMAMR